MSAPRSSRRRRARLIYLIGAAAFLASPPPTPTVVAAEAVVEPDDEDEKKRQKEYTVKAAFLFNFLKYTTWPEETFEEPDDPIVLGIAGADPFGALLDKILKDKKVGKRPIVIRRFDKVAKVEGAHALFVGAMTRKEREALVEAHGESAVLLIGDEHGLAAADGLVASFFLKDGKVRFEVSTKASERAKLTISSQLLKLAEIVERRKK